MRLSKRGTVNWATTFQTTTPDNVPMSRDEFRHLCATLAINDSRTAGELFGLSWRTCQRYWYDDLAVPGPLARLLRLAAKHDTTHDELRGTISRRTRLRSKAKL
jgi:hypothetical protein